MKLSKACTKCKNIKNIDEFYRKHDGKYGASSHCKICDFYKKKKWQEENGEKVADSNKKWRKNNKKKSYNIQRANGLRSNYKMSIEDYDNMLLQQNNQCAICKINKNKLNRKLDVDHCHTSGKVRKLLCRSCNVSLGRLNEDVFTLTNMIEYIYEHLND